MNQKERAQMMGTEKVPVILKKLALPAIIGMMVTAIYNIVDTLFVSFLGTEAVGAVSIVYPLFLLLLAVGLMFGVGSASFISRLLGENKKNKAEEVATTTITVSVITGIVLSFILFIFMKEVLTIFGATPTIMPYALNYGRMLSVGAVFTISNMAMNNILRSEGSAKYSMIALMTGALINIALDPFFIFTLNLGIEGAALATVIAQASSTLLLFSFFLRKKSVLHLHFSSFKPSFLMFKEVSKIGIPTFARQILLSLSMALLNTAAKPYGDEAIAALGVSARVFSLATMVIFGFSQAFQPVAGYNYGALKIQRLKEALKTSLRWTTMVTSLSTVIYFAFTPQIIGLFTDDPTVMAIGIQAMRYMVIFFPLFGFQVIYGTLFQALGKGAQAGILSLSRQGIFFIPAILIFPKIFDLQGIFLAQPFADFSTIILTVFFAKKIHKELNLLEK